MMIAVAPVVMDLINNGAIALLFALRSGQSPLRIYFEMISDYGSVGHLAFIAQLGLGLLAAIVADASTWALVLLVLPAFAVQHSLGHQVRLRLKVEEALRRSEANLVAAQRIAGLGSWERMPSGTITWSDETYRIFGYQPKAFTPSLPLLLAAVHPADRERVEQVVLAPTPTNYSIDYRIRRHDGSERVVHEQGEVVVDDEGAPLRLVGTILDITEGQALEERLVYQAFHDPLTALPNRALFNDRLDQALARAARGGTMVGLLFIDLDSFKIVNDGLGHDVGDRLLVAVAARLRAAVRPEDTVARLGGDECTVLREGCIHEQDITGTADRIAAAFEEIQAVDGHPVIVTASIGIVWSVGGHETRADLLRYADIAMYRAKQEGKARYALFDHAPDAVVAARPPLEAATRCSVVADELAVL